jgi:hypothetical protein
MWRITMKKLLSLSLALTALSVLPASAMALDTRYDYEMRLRRAGERSWNAGTLRFSLDENRASSCVYAIEWVNPSGTNTTDCFVEEQKTHAYRSCTSNATRNIGTTIELLDEMACYGFDQFGAMQAVVRLVIYETTGSRPHSGIIQFEGPFSTIYPIELWRRVR